MLSRLPCYSTLRPSNNLTIPQCFEEVGYIIQVDVASLLDGYKLIKVIKLRILFELGKCFRTIHFFL